MSDQNSNKPAVVTPEENQSSDPKNRNFQRPNDAPLGREDSNHRSPEGFINLNKSDAEDVKEAGVTPNKGEQDGGAGS